MSSYYTVIHLKTFLVRGGAGGGMGECDSFYHATNESLQGVLWVIGKRRMIDFAKWDEWNLKPYG